MITLVILGLIIVAAVCAIFAILTKRKAPYPVFAVATIFLAVQAAYLCQVIFDHTPGSEAWIFLALTYIPLASVLFLLVSALSIATAVKANATRKKMIAFSAMPIHGVCSYAILSLWGVLFRFPL